MAFKLFFSENNRRLRRKGATVIVRRDTKDNFSSQSSQRPTPAAIQSKHQADKISSNASSHISHYLTKQRHRGTAIAVQEKQRPLIKNHHTRFN